VSLVLSTRVVPIPIPPPNTVVAAERTPVVTTPSGEADVAAARRQLRALSRPWPRPVEPLEPAPEGAILACCTRPAGELTLDL
jgi:hypothetical protein